jgi:integrase
MAIYPDKKGDKLTGRFRVEVQLDGRRIRGRFDTLAEAKKKEDEWKRQLASGDTSGATEREDLRGAPKTLLQLLDKAAPLIWNASAHGIDAEGKVRRIATRLSDPKLSDLNTGHIDELILWLRSEGRSPGTVNRYLSALHVVLGWGHAKGRGYVPVMPEFTWQDEDEGRIRWLTATEERKLVQTLNGMGQEAIAAFVVVAIDTGCRRGELLNTPRLDLDGDWLRLWGDRTKTKRSRSVPLTARAKLLLDRHLPWRFSDRALRYWFDKAKEAMGLAEDEDFVVHALRHTCATRLVEKGVNLRVVQQYMGHRSINTTLRYAHVSDELLAKAAFRLQGQADFIQLTQEVGAEQPGYMPHLSVVSGGALIEKVTGEQSQPVLPSHRKG